MGRNILLGAIFAVIAAACATIPATGQPGLTGLMTPAEETRVGRDQSPELIKAFGGVYNDPALAGYVNRVGQSLACVGERRDLRFSFTVLDSPIVNAMALPGGYVFITRGLLALVGNEAELAGVLGHEIGHITARHHARSQSLEILTGVGLTILQAVIGPAVAQGVQPLTQNPAERLLA